MHESCKGVLKDKQDQRKKGYKTPLSKNIPPTYSMNLNQPSESKMAETARKNLRHPIKCWGCGEEHFFRDCPRKGNKGETIHNLQEATMVEDVGKSIPPIYVALDNKQVVHQSTMIDVKGMIVDVPISILIDSGANHSYINTNTIEICQLVSKQLVKPRTVQLATSMKRKITSMVKDCYYGYGWTTFKNIFGCNTFGLL